MKLTREWWEHIVKAIILEDDYDSWKSFNPEFNEDGPDGAQGMLDDLVKAGQEADKEFKARKK